MTKIEKGEQAVSIFVEIQKRTGKVGMKDFGNWVYKMQTLPAKGLVGLSEAGFTQPVLKHVKRLHQNSVSTFDSHKYDLIVASKVST